MEVPIIFGAKTEIGEARINCKHCDHKEINNSKEIFNNEEEPYITVFAFNNEYFKKFLKEMTRNTLVRILCHFVLKNLHDYFSTDIFHYHKKWILLYIIFLFANNI